MSEEALVLLRELVGMGLFRIVWGEFGNCEFCGQTDHKSDCIILRIERLLDSTKEDEG